MTGFAERLADAVRRTGSAVMVGIDPQWESLPPTVRDEALAAEGPTLAAVARAYEQFGNQVIDLIADRAGVVKFQMAFFEAAGPAGLVALDRLARRAAQAGLLVVMDGKRNDIGNTAAAYAAAYLGSVAVVSGSAPVRPWQADALTVNPYLGDEGLTPFLDTAAAHGTGLFVLVRTSNAGAAQYQELSAEGRSVCERVADRVEAWSRDHRGPSGYGPVGAVVGATVPQQLVSLRQRMPHAWLLIPGYGAQGGSAADVAAAFDLDGLGAVVNNSRGLLYAYRDPRHAGRSWTDATVAALDDMNNALRAVRNRARQ